MVVETPAFRNGKCSMGFHFSQDFMRTSPQASQFNNTKKYKWSR
jgi:hypothetical protein